MTEHVDVAGMRIGYRRAGGGPSLLLLHGAVCDGRVWIHALDALSDAFTVVAWDAPGCGESSDPPSTWRMAEFADCLAGFVGALSLGRTHVLGHSWGSTLALELSLRHPSMIERLVLVGAYAGWAGSLPAGEVEQRLAFAQSAADAMRAGTWDPPSMPGLFTNAMPASHAAELTSIMGDVRPEATRTMAQAMAEADQSSSLARVAAPTLLLYGGNDERAPRPIAERLHAAIGASQLVMLAGLGHECYLEDPATFARVVRDFLE